ncbi:MAG: hypothetical protein WAN35_03585 [Terracidiphilus sp.]
MAIPELLRSIELSGATVTIDAIGSQRAISGQIVAQKAYYIPAILADIKDSFQMLAADSVDQQVDYRHGRVETCRCSVLADLSLLDKLVASRT